jgi:hypothetical protein
MRETLIFQFIGGGGGDAPKGHGLGTGVVSFLIVIGIIAVLLAIVMFFARKTG